MQKVEPLTKILTGVVEAANRAKRKTRPAIMVKISPDEDSEEQVSGICDAVWESGVDGVIVGNTTTRRPDPSPTGYTLPPREAAAMLEQGGYSGPQLFDRTLSLVRKYRRKLDQGPDNSSSPPFPGKTTPEPQPQSTSPPDPPAPQKLDLDTSVKIDATIVRDIAHIKPQTPEAETASKVQPLIRIPTRNNPFSTESADSDASPALSSSNHITQLPPTPTASGPTASSSTPPPMPPRSKNVAAPVVQSERKVIFATGGITNGKQALEILDAGASVAMIYTAVSQSRNTSLSAREGECK